MSQDLWYKRISSLGTININVGGGRMEGFRGKWHHFSEQKGDTKLFAQYQRGNLKSTYKKQRILTLLKSRMHSECATIWFGEKFGSLSWKKKDWKFSAKLQIKNLENVKFNYATKNKISLQNRNGKFYICTRAAEKDHLVKVFQTGNILPQKYANNAINSSWHM